MSYIKSHYNFHIASTSDCIRNSIYSQATVISSNVQVKTAIECKNECEKEANCNFWDMYNKNCRLLSDKGNGVNSRYPGALAGTKTCYLKENSPKGKHIALESCILTYTTLIIHDAFEILRL